MDLDGLQLAEESVPAPRDLDMAAVEPDVEDRLERGEVDIRSATASDALLIPCSFYAL